MQTRNDLTYEYVSSRLIYHFDTGIFIWKPIPAINRHDKRWNTRYAGKTAGTPHKKGYITISLDRGLYLAHRLAWLLTYKSWPEFQIDHENTIKSDNRIDNLRIATNSENHLNVGEQSNNKSNQKGVHWDKDRNKWMVYININGRRKYLGRYDNFKTAVNKYKNEAIILHGIFLHKSLT